MQELRGTRAERWGGVRLCLSSVALDRRERERERLTEGMGGEQSRGRNLSAGSWARREGKVFGAEALRTRGQVRRGPAGWRVGSPRQDPSSVCLPVVKPVLRCSLLWPGAGGSAAAGWGSGLSSCSAGSGRSGLRSCRTKSRGRARVRVRVRRRASALSTGGGAAGGCRPRVTVAAAGALSPRALTTPAAAAGAHQQDAGHLGSASVPAAGLALLYACSRRGDARLLGSPSLSEVFVATPGSAV